MHQVFIDDKPLLFADIYKDLSAAPEGYLIYSDSEKSLEEVLAKLSKKKTPGIVYLSSSPDQSWNSFVSRYVLSEAAGGFVKNTSGDYLVIFRKKMWDLPKGKLDYAESPENAAIREVQEECGIKNIELGKPIVNTFHTYTEKNKFILKKTHWFSMTTTDFALHPQREEGIEQAVWISKQNIYTRIFPLTYGSVKIVVNKYFEMNKSEE